MGVVYKAHDLRLDRFVALKLLPAEKVADPDRKWRFVQEARAASALNHPNIVTVYDITAADGVDFMAREYIAGKTLDRVIGRKGLRVGEALGYAVQIADALAKAHSNGIVHRDLKPANIMVNEDGVVCWTRPAGPPMETCSTSFPSAMAAAVSGPSGWSREHASPPARPSRSITKTAPVSFSYRTGGARWPSPATG